MQSDTYRNGILTSIAILLAVVAWANVSEQSILVSEAQAQVRSRPAGTARYPVSRDESDMGVSSIGERAVVQRDELIAELQRLRLSVDAIASRLARGDLQVRVAESQDDSRSRPREDDSQ